MTDFFKKKPVIYIDVFFFFFFCVLRILNVLLHNNLIYNIYFLI
jgi:hypothetical protein